MSFVANITCNYLAYESQVITLGKYRRKMWDQKTNRLNVELFIENILNNTLLITVS